MRRPAFGRFMAAGLFLVVFAAAAEAAEPARIGIFRGTPPPDANLKAFHEGMREHGHVEGKTYVMRDGDVVNFLFNV